MIDPNTNRPFYVGKGTGKRVLAHIRALGRSPVAKRVQELARAGQPLVLDILKHGLKAHEALQVEAAVIDALRAEKLLNRVSGHGTRWGRKSLDELVMSYSATPAKIDDRVILINIAKTFRTDMLAEELYDYTRSAWRVNDKIVKSDCGPEYAFAVYQSIIREVYKIAGWLAGGSTMRVAGRLSMIESNRMEFVGRIADGAIRKKYVGKSVDKYVKKGSQNPIRYVHCE